MNTDEHGLGERALFHSRAGTEDFYCNLVYVRGILSGLMGTSQNYLKAYRRIEKMLIDDARRLARRVLLLDRPGGGRRTPEQKRKREALERMVERDIAAIPRLFPPSPSKVSAPKAGFDNLDTLLKSVDRTMLDRMIASAREDPSNPANWHARLVNEELAKPHVAKIYMKMRRSLWRWEEFAGLKPGARRILEIVLELARDEAFPWYVAVPAEDVRRLARLTEGSYARSVRELECLAVTRPARVLCVSDHIGSPIFPGTVDESQPPTAIAQFVMRYRRGIPWNKKRAAWWINYDLLCETERVLPCFVMKLRTLNKTYQGRNMDMGPHPGQWFCKPESDGFAAMEERLARIGPLPPEGLRAALWNGVL